MYFDHHPVRLLYIEINNNLVNSKQRKNVKILRSRTFSGCRTRVVRACVSQYPVSEVHTLNCLRRSTGDTGSAKLLSLSLSLTLNQSESVSGSAEVTVTK